MAHVGTLRDYRFQGDTDDIRGSNIYNRNDDKLGKIDDVIFNHASGDIEYLVVDTGGWLSSHKFLVPADRVSATDDDDRYVVDLTKEQIERFPEYNEKLHQEGDDKNWREYEDRYRSNWTEAGGVLHREGSPNILTPDANEMPPASGSRTTGDVTPTRLAPTFTDTAPSSDKIRMRPEGTASQAEDTRFPGTARNTESSNWQKPEIEREESGIPRSNIRRVDNTLADDTGRNISNADLTDDTADLTDESARFREESAYGNVGRTVAPHADAGAPASYRGTVGDVRDDLSRPYPVQQGRGERWRAFEENLRRNRVDITASCRSCSPAKDKAA
jgi:sporulation protein YlmC with PRC-barrel domain